MLAVEVGSRDSRGMGMTANGCSVTGLYITPGEGEAMMSTGEVMALAGVGLQGDRYALETGHYSHTPRRTIRHASLIAEEGIAEANENFGLNLTPAQMRRNIITEGFGALGLNQLVGEEFRIGGVAVRGVELCAPCTYLAGKLKVEGKTFLHAFKLTGGLRVELLTSGLVQVGDTVTID